MTSLWTGRRGSLVGPLKLLLAVVSLTWLLTSCRAGPPHPTVAGAGAPSTVVASATISTTATQTAPGRGATQPTGPAAAASRAGPAPRPAAGGATPTDTGFGQVSRLMAPGAAITSTGSLPGWHTYSDPTAGYSVSLPPGADFRAGWSAGGVYTARAQFAIPGVTGYQGLVVRVEPNPAGHGLEQILAEVYQTADQDRPPADLLAQAQAITVAGLSAVKVAGSGQDFAVIIPYGDKTYTLAPVHSMATAAVDPQALALFEQVLQTFRMSR